MRRRVNSFQSLLPPIYMSAATAYPAVIEQFLQALLDTAGIIDPVVRETAMHDVSAQLEEFLTLKLAAELSDADRAEFFEMIEAFPNSFDAYAFFAEKLPELPAKIEGFLPEFRQTFVTAATHEAV